MTPRPPRCAAAALAAVLLLGAAAGAKGVADHPALGIEPLFSATEMGAGINRVSDDMGEMVADIGLVLSRSPGGAANVSPEALDDALRFEPFDLVGALERDDLVLLMRHGPTDWSERDRKDVAPGDCGDQRVMTPLGEEQMRSMGILMAGNGLRPGKVIASEWCRNQQTLDRVLEGFALVDPAYAEAVPVETSADLNLLLSLQGAPDVTAMREAILAWDGPEEGDPEGPLLMISHFTNIAELTEFHVYEGEALIVDPRRDGRVLGYLRLRSAAPDEGHFQPGETATNAGGEAGE
jgi:hypothetical protein